MEESPPEGNLIYNKQIIRLFPQQTKQTKTRNNHDNPQRIQLLSYY